MKKQIINIFSVAIIIFAAIMVSCNHETATQKSEYKKPLYQPRYASGLQILGNGKDNCSLVRTINPWQGADSTSVPALFIQRSGANVPDGIDFQILKGEAKRIICMSSSHVAMLDALGCIERVVGVSGIDYISNSYICKNKDKIADLGFDGNVDYEKLVALNPDLVILYGVGTASPMESKLKELKIPFLYLGEYTEESPLGKAEWLIAMGEIVNKREKAIEIFNRLPNKYFELKKAAKSAKYHPTVMVNTPYQDQWLMPSTNCYAVTLIKDAAGQYVYSQNNSNRSVPIDMERAWSLAKNADCWINIGQIETKANLLQMLPKFADVKPVKNCNVWNTTLKVTAGGGNDYWESGILHPDLVLQDLIKIFHPELLQDKEFTYYKRIE